MFFLSRAYVFKDSLNYRLRKDLDAYRNSENFPKSNEPMLKCTLLLLLLLPPAAAAVVVVDNKELNDLYPHPIFFGSDGQGL